MCCAPQNFCLGNTTLTLMMANSFYVDESYRGAGTSIFLKYLQFGRRYPLFVSSASPAVAEIWRKLGGYALGHSDRELVGVVRWRPVIAESVHRKTDSNRAAQIAAAIASPWFAIGGVLFRWRALRETVKAELIPVESPDVAAGICAAHRSDKITSCRDLPFLKWRYFSPVEPNTRLFAFRRPGKEEKQFLVGVRLQRRGYKQQIRTLQVLDIWGEPDPALTLDVALCLQDQYREQIDMMAFRCLNPMQQDALTASGFRARLFLAPIAWCIDKYGLLPGKMWYLVPADGDMFL
jgi:hypothetical protein